MNNKQISELSNHIETNLFYCALWMLTKSGKPNPLTLPFWFDLANKAYDHAEFQIASLCFAELKKGANLGPLSLAKFAECLLRSGRRPLAIKLIQQLSKAPQMLPQMGLDIVLELGMRTNQTNLVDQVGISARSRFPNNAYYWFVGGERLQDDKEYVKALSYYMYGSKLAKQWTEYKIKACRLLITLGKLDAANHLLDGAVTETDCVANLTLIKQLYEQMGSFDGVSHCNLLLQFQAARK